MSKNVWNDLIAGLPEAHLLQTYEWGQVKAHYSWEPLYLVWRKNVPGMLVALEPAALAELSPVEVQAAALVLRKPILRGSFAAQVCILYCPKGPLLNWADPVLRSRVLDDLQRFARKEGSIFLKFDPDVVLGLGLPGTESDQPDVVGLSVEQDLVARGWQYSQDQIQFRNTVMLDVSLAEEDLLARMKQKTRYNVRLGPKKGLGVRIGTDLDWPLLYKMYAETSVRDGFVIRDEAYYRVVWQSFAASSAPLIAETAEGEAVAGVFLFHFAGRAYYIYGMSREAHRDLMPNYLLQFEAMRWARQQGCNVYDLWGAPELFDERDSMWGVFRFKEGLGGQVRRTLGAWDYAPNHLWYQIYTQLMPKVLNFMRSRGKIRTRQSLEA
ncbi:MAG: peptidoglycan bridge formation glycyltransferase FemA/FemB family protein [Chloroflexota bacterium]